MKSMQINEYLEDSDSDFDDHKSVTSQNIDQYKQNWDVNLRKYNNAQNIRKEKFKKKDEYEHI